MADETATDVVDWMRKNYPHNEYLDEKDYDDGSIKLIFENGIEIDSWEEFEKDLKNKFGRRVIFMTKPYENYITSKFTLLCRNSYYSESLKESSLNEEHTLVKEEIEELDDAIAEAIHQTSVILKTHNDKET